jgi:hypothetical protein
LGAIPVRVEAAIAGGVIEGPAPSRGQMVVSLWHA